MAGEDDIRVLYISQQLRELGDELHNDPELRRIIYNVAQESYVGRQYSRFTKLIRQFVMLVAQSSSVSANMVERVIRNFLLLWSDRELSGKVLQELDPGTSVDTPETSTETAGDTSETSDVHMEIPEEIKLMDDEFIHRYLEVLRSGHQKVKSIRLMVVGMFGVGKTTLVENLVEKAEMRTERKVESTVGIDLTNCDIIDGKWIVNILEVDTSEKVLEVMSTSGLLNTSDDHVDAGSKAVTNDAGEDKIIYNRTRQANISSEPETSDNKQENERNFEMLKEKLIENYDPEVRSFMKKLFDSTDRPHRPLQPTISVWDFAGQFIYYSTHHFFLNSRSIYLLLMDISKPLGRLIQETSDFPLSGFCHKGFTCLEAFKFWLNSIHMYSSLQVQQEVQPSVILVGTHKDMLDGSEEEKEVLKEKYFNEALKSFIASPVLKHVHRKKFLINNVDKAEDFGRIRDEVMEVATKQTYWGEERPAKWISLERTFVGLKSEGKEIISFDEIITADRQNDVPIKSEEELRFFLQFQHSLGNILYYETEVLKHHVILSPQWIIDAFRCFISHVKDKDPKQLAMWENFEANAILSQELIDEIFENTEKYREYKKQVIEYMEHLDMLARPIGPVKFDLKETSHRTVNQRASSTRSSLSTEDDLETDNVEDEMETDDVGPQTPIGLADLDSSYHKAKVLETEGPFSKERMNLQKYDSNTSASSVEHEHFYIVPCLLKPTPPASEISHLINPSFEDKTPILCLKFQNKFMPPSVFHRLLAVCIRKWKIVEENNHSQLFNGFAAFYITIAKTSMLSIWFQDNIIYARVSFYAEVDKRFLAQKMRLFLRQSVTEILTILPKESRITEVMPFDEFIQCPCVKAFEPGVGLLRLRDFFYNEYLMCSYLKSHAVKKSDGIGLWCYDNTKKQEVTTIPRDVLQRLLTIKDLGRVARAIGKEYFRLGLELGLPRPILQQIKDDHRNHLATTIFHMLYKFKSNCHDCTVEQLRNVLIAVESDVESFDKVFDPDSAQSVELGTVEGIDYSRKPTDANLSSLVDGIGSEYWLLGVELGIPVTTIEQLRHDHITMGARVYNMLLKWNKKHDSSIEELGKALCMVGADMAKFYEVFTPK